MGTVNQCYFDHFLPALNWVGIVECVSVNIMHSMVYNLKLSVMDLQFCGILFVGFFFMGTEQVTVDQDRLERKILKELRPLL
jgi:hypothetical protein